ncbi:MAG: K+/H+ antiporter subunit F [Rubellimicrobium sp.]|nr:K+/H+ antiporter subunit F [Rubellimicrobium sp.]
MSLILTAALIYGQVALAVAALLALWRLLKGPRAQDRVLALDTFYVCIMLQLLVTGLRLGNPHFLVAALIIALMSFVSSVAAARFLLRGEVIE